MKRKSQLGVVAGGVSIAFSSLCFLVVPVFTPGIVLAAIVGAIGGFIAMVLQARRSAFLAFTFALTPLFGFLLIEYDPAGFDTGYLAFIALGVALVVAVLALVDYSREKRASPRNI